MKLRIATYLLVTAFFIGSITPTFSQSPEQLFQKGLVKEEGEGALNEAIDIYIKIVDNQDADKALQAKALLHVGQCYEKLGRNEATKAYQRLVNNFPGQKNEVAIAKERLSKLLVVEKVPKTPPEPKFRKIRTPFNIPQWSGSRLSPDGKTLAFGSGKAIWIVPIPGRVDPDLAGEPMELKGGEDVLGDGLSWSGDGHWIAFSRSYVHGGGTRINFNPEGAYIDVIPSSGGEPKRIPVPQWVDTNGDTQRRLSLSHDGKMVAFDAGGQIYVASVETSDIKQLTNIGGMSPCFSPDGTKIAYLTPFPNPPFIFNEVWVMSVKGEDPVKVSGDLGSLDLGSQGIISGVDLESLDLESLDLETLNLASMGVISGKGPTWSPDGKMIAFGRRIIDGRPEVCLVTISNQGKPVGSPMQIELPLHSEDFVTGWTPDNKIGLLLESSFHENVYTVSVLGGKATQMSRGGSHPRWSPDGKRIYFRKSDGINSAPSDGGERRRHSYFAQDENVLFLQYPGGGNFISPDGKSIVFTGGTATYGPNIYTIPIEGGDPKQINDKGQYPCWSPDGNWIAYIAKEIVDDKKPISTIFKMPREGGESIKITSASDLVTEGGFDWSPDGKWIAYYSKKEGTSAGTLNLIPTNGGESREICRVRHIIPHNELSWSPDGHQIAFTSMGKIWLVSANGGEPVEVKTEVDAFAAMLDWSPDGKKFTFSGNGGGKPEFWFMEDFLPLDKLSKNKETEAAKEPEGIKIRQIWKAPYLDDLGTVSFDGEYRSYVDWGLGNVGIHNLKTDENKILTDEANLGEAWQFAQSTVISRDGKKIVYSWANPYNTNSLRLINVENLEPELLYKKTGEELYPSAWLSDKEIVAFRSIPDSMTMQLVTFNIKDKKTKVKKTFMPGQFVGGLACSPDEKYIAYGFANNADNGNTDIRLLEANGDRDIPLIAHPSNDKVIGWLPGSKEFLFISDRAGSWDLWAIKLDGTKPSGPTKRIYADIGEVSPMGFTRDGECYFGFSRRNFYSGLAPFNKETGEIDLATGQSFESQNFLITWSPDGQHLAYIKIEDNSKGNPLKLFVQDVKTGEKYQPDDNKLRISSYSWSPDGNSILVVGREISKLQEKDYKGGVFKVDIRTGRIDQIFLLSEYEYNRPEDDSSPLSCIKWSPDGKSFYYLFQKDRLVKHNLETGEDIIIYEYSDFTPYVLEASPDGNNLLFGLEYPGGEKGSLYIIPAEGGKEKVVCTSQEAQRIVWAKYSPDGKYIYFAELPQSTRSVLWRVPVEGGNPEKVWSPGNRVEVYDIHPDGNQVAFSIRERKTEVRVIENLKQELEKIYSQNE